MVDHGWIESIFGPIDRRAADPPSPPFVSLIASGVSDGLLSLWEYISIFTLLRRE